MRDISTLWLTHLEHFLRNTRVKPICLHIQLIVQEMNCFTLPSGWTIRIYHNYTYGTNSRETLDAYFGESSQVASHVDLCYFSELMEASSTSHQQDSFEMTWRFLPLLDELVDVFASRDGDSFIYQRELDAVDEW